MGAYKLGKPSLGAPGNVTVILLAKNEHKVNKVVSVYLGKYQY